ncbi:MAG: hypothetical protein J6S58_03195, partial [Lentisphaeria bacterium]|nr:hypothetical protein [Lentisphaeria bacterium]
MTELAENGTEYSGKCYLCHSACLVDATAVADAVRDSYKAAMDQNPSVPSFIHAYRNFMTRAILTMFSYGAYNRATAYYRQMRKEDPGHRANHFTLEQFIYDSWAEEMRSIGYKQAQDLISGMIVKACMLIAYGDMTAAESNLRMAEICYRWYEKDQNVERVKLVSFEQMKAFIAGTVIKSLPPELASRLKGFVALEVQEKKAAEKQTAAPR